MRQPASALAALAAGAALLGCGMERSREESDAKAKEPDPQLLECTSDDQPTNFTAYSLGKSFEGMRIVYSDRVCTEPDPASPVPDARVNMVHYIYGKCERTLKTPKCRPPLEVQAWPRCEREPAEYDTGSHNPLYGTVTIRGVPGYLYEDGYRLELLAAKSTIAIFGDDRSQLIRAGRALVKAPAKPSTPPTDGDASEDLPPPPAEPIAC